MTPEAIHKINRARIESEKDYIAAFCYGFAAGALVTIIGCLIFRII